MIDEVVLEIEGRRYHGHLWAEPGPPPLGSGATLHWRFSSRGHFVAEFPALPTDTEELVRSRLTGTLERIRARQASRAPHLRIDSRTL